jgi:hypothetical protein
VPPTLEGLEVLELSLGGEPAYVPRYLPGGKTTWSHSSQALAEHCPTLWKRRYLDKLPDPPTAGMLAGGAFGAALEHLYAAALLTHSATADEVAEVAAASFDERAAGEGAGISELPALRERVVDSARAYARERAPVTLRALGDGLRAVERRFQLRLSGLDAGGRPVRCEWAISGYLDLEAASEVRDFKLVGKAHPTQAHADASLQGGLYLLARAAEGEPAGRFVLDSTRREHGPRSRTPRFAEVSTTRSQDALVALQRRIAATTLAVALYEASGSWPFAPPAWWCTPRQCHAWGGCAGGGLAAGHAPQPVAVADDADRRAAA